MEEQQERQMTEAELAEFRQKMMAHYTEMMPFLEVQAKYENLLKSIEDDRFMRMTRTVQIRNFLFDQKVAEEQAIEEAARAAKEPMKKV